MKIFASILILLSVSIAWSRSIYLPVRSAVISTPEIRDIPACSAVMELDHEFKHIKKAILKVGEKEYAFPIDALTKIEFPDISTMRIETQMGLRGQRCFSIVLSQSRDTKNVTRYHITVIGGRFSQVTNVWDEPRGDLIKRHFETLYENTTEQGSAHQSTTR